jgi:hypothetical protein
METIRTFLKTVRGWPVVGPLLDLLSRERVLLLLLALVAYYLVPSIQNISKDTAVNLGNLIFYGGGIVLLGLSAESLMETKALLPTTVGGITTELIQAATAPTVTTTTTVAPTPMEAQPVAPPIATEPLKIYEGVG